MLEERLRRVAAAGRLRIPEADAVTLVHAAGTGAVLALLEQDPAVRRDDLAEPLLDAVLARILTDATPREGG
ncbi:TetR family transcriptional regulator, partial [Acinetobacter baumannii]